MANNGASTGVRWIESRSFVSYDGNGQPERAIGVNTKGEFGTAGRLLRIKGLTRDITERKALEEQKNILIAELDHRVKNVLAVVAVVASRTQETNSSMTAFVARRVQLS